MVYFLVFHAPASAARYLNVFRYITVRTAMASLTALFLGLIAGPWTIHRLRQLHISQFIREEGPASHQAKAGTPTMGGVLIVAATLIPALFWADLADPYVLLAMFCILAFGAIGFADDYTKVTRRHNRGLTGNSKLFYQIVVSVVAGLTLVMMRAYGVYSTQ